ncbi:MAG: glycerophosphodiester phosphodiesterase family protein [Myxococcota bacterium]
MELVAHRGANWHFPGNTLPAFRRAIEDGATVLEMDVRKTRDNVIVLCHDPHWKGRKIAKTRFEVFGNELPRLEEVLEAFPSTPLIVDIKSNDIKAVYLIVDMIRDYGAIGRVCLSSFHWDVHRWIHDLKYEGEHGLSRIELALLFVLPSAAIQLLGWRRRRAQPPLRYGVFNFAASWFVKKCHALGISVDYWVVNQLDIGRMLKDIGADRVMTDDPATLASLGSP